MKLYFQNWREASGTIGDTKAVPALVAASNRVPDFVSDFSSLNWTVPYVATEEHTFWVYKTLELFLIYFVNGILKTAMITLIDVLSQHAHKIFRD